MIKKIVQQMVKDNQLAIMYEKDGDEMQVQYLRGKYKAYKDVLKMMGFDVEVYEENFTWMISVKAQGWEIGDR